MLSGGDEQRVRVSCACLCRIRDAQGRYLLALNQNRLEKGQRIFTPLGGGLEYTAPDLLKRFDALAEKPGFRELRLYVPQRRLDDFQAWFLRRTERETDPFRELYEELVEELRAVDTLSREDVRFQVAAVLNYERVTDRIGAEGEKTRYWLEVFDVALVAPALRAALSGDQTPGALRWFTPEQMAAGMTSDGAIVEGSALLG